MVRALVVLVFLAAAASVSASEIETSRRLGHPREHFPLSVRAAVGDDAELEAAVRRAVTDWNLVSQEAIGVTAFSMTGGPAADVIVTADPRAPEKLMGETEMNADDAGVLRSPVRITLMQVKARGQTPRAVLVYQIVAHELGHALGLRHSADPRSIMCCEKGRVDLRDTATREAYIEARRAPDLRSVETELRAHYAAFWEGR